MENNLNVTKINTMDLKKAVGLRIKRKREQLKLSQEKLAELCELSPNYIGCIERGKNMAKVLTLHKIANKLGISLGVLFKDL